MTATVNSIVTNIYLKGVVTNSYGNVTNKPYVLPKEGLVDNWDASINESITLATGVSSWASQVVGGHPLVQAVGASQPVYDPATNSITCDGVAQFLKSAAFTFNQPSTVYFAGQQISWTNGDRIYDGNANGSMALLQSGVTPALVILAGASAASNTDLAVGSDGVICSVFNGASSSNKVNDNVATTGNAGASNAGGFTLGRVGAAAVQFGHIAVYEIAIYSVAHDAATQTSIINGLMSKHGVS